MKFVSFDTVRDCHLFLIEAVGDGDPTEELLTSAIDAFATSRGIEPEVMQNNYLFFAEFNNVLSSLADSGWIEPVPVEIN